MSFYLLLLGSQLVKFLFITIGVCGFFPGFLLLMFGEFCFCFFGFGFVGWLFVFQFWALNPWR